MSNDDLLTAALRGMADEDRRHGVSGAVEARLRAEVQAVAAARRRVRTRRYAVTLAAAAALAVAVTGSVWRASRQQTVPSAPRSGDVAALASREIVTEFMPLTYGDVPMTGGNIVRLQVPRAALASFGLTPPEAAPAAGSSDTVLADVVVGDDGLARAVRFVRSGS